MLTPINWNEVSDPLDLEVWNRLVGNFWVPEKVAVSNDIKSWNTLSSIEQKTTMRVFAGLTLLDTLQGSVGAVAMLPYARTKQEEAVLQNISFMEAVHAKSYSNIFMTLSSTKEINEAFSWAESNPTLQTKAQAINSWYVNKDDNGLMMKAASVLLESFLFYSGFYLPLNYSANSKLTNTADIIRLILRDEGVHGFYLGQKFQQGFNELNKEDRKELQNKVIALAKELLENELKYTEELYSDLGWVKDVKSYLKYNLNKALANLGFMPMFDGAESKVKASILAQMSLDTNEAHDFFSGSGSSYVIAEVEDTEDDDWQF